MRKGLVAGALWIASCSHAPKAPPFKIEITRLGATIDAVGWDTDNSEEEKLTHAKALVPTETPGLFKTADAYMGRMPYVADMRLGPYPKGSGTVTFETLEITSHPWIQPSTPTASDCATQEMADTKQYTTYVRILAEPKNVDRHGIDTVVWEDEANFMMGVGPETRRVRMVAAKGKECFLFEVSSNKNLWDKVEKRLRATLDTLAPS